MTRKRKRRKPEQIVKLLQEGHAMLAAGKSEAEVFSPSLPGSDGTVSTAV